MIGRRGDVFAEDNLAFDRDGRAVEILHRSVNRLAAEPAWPDGLDPLPAAQVIEAVLATVGARPRERDAIDRRIIRDVRERKGRIIDSQEEVGGYPRQEPTRRALEVPEDGLDAWLAGVAADLE